MPWLSTILGPNILYFEWILDLDVDFLKIDAKYIKNIDVHHKSYEICRAITYFARNTNIACIAEFVHSKTIQTIIEELGIDFSQGYCFSKPTPRPSNVATIDSDLR